MSDLFRVAELVDEHDPRVLEAVALFREGIGAHDVHSPPFFQGELRAARLGEAADGDLHLVTLLDADDHPVAAATGVYLAGVDAGFVTYLATRADLRGMELGRWVRAELVRAIEAEARRRGRGGLRWVAGEVRRQSRWLRSLVERGEAIPFDLEYVHPWMKRGGDNPYLLYREPLADRRAELPVAEVAALIRGIYQRAYRVDRPERNANFGFLLGQLEGRSTIGIDPEFEAANLSASRT